MSKDNKITCNDINCMCYECLKEHWRNGCDYGKAELDDTCKECDCDYKG